MATKTSLVNIGLRRAMCSRVNDVDTDTGKEARCARDVYEDKRDDLLRSYLWSFSKKRVALSTVVTVPAFGVDYAYALPADYLRVISVHPSDSDFSMCRYKIETILVSGTPTLVIVTNIPTVIYLRYVAQQTTISLYDPMFRNTFAWDLASEFALSIKESSSHAEYCEKMKRRSISEAKSVNSIEDWPDPFPAGSWVNERFVEGNDAWGGDTWA